MPPVHDDQDPERTRAEAAKEDPCPYCQAGIPTKLQATGWSDKIGKPCHILGSGYGEFEWCKKGGYPPPPRPRHARCGACGSERQVDGYMRRHPSMQYQARPTETLDVFYCGCQDDPWL